MEVHDPQQNLITYTDVSAVSTMSYALGGGGGVLSKPKENN